MKPLVSVIIVTWNGISWLKRCLPTLEQVTYKPVQWIIVDNASTDGSVEWVKMNYPKATVLVNDRNLGFSHANNIGYKVARGEYILFLNNDTEVTPQFITELVRVFESNPKVGCAQSKILLLEDKSRLDSVGAFLTPTGFLYHYGFRQKDEPKYDKQIDLYTAKGACMMFRSDVLKKVEVEGWIFDPDYFAYFEETDLCHRVWLAGYRVVYAYKSVIYHKMGATSSGMDNAFVQYHSFKNRINSYIKNLGVTNLLPLLCIHIPLCIGFAVFSLARLRASMAAAIVKALVWNIRMLPRSLRTRRVIQQQIRKWKDKELLVNIEQKPGLGYYWALAEGLHS